MQTNMKYVIYIKTIICVNLWQHSLRLLENDKPDKIINLSFSNKGNKEIIVCTTSRTVPSVKAK